MTQEHDMLLKSESHRLVTKTPRHRGRIDLKDLLDLVRLAIGISKTQL